VPPLGLGAGFGVSPVGVGDAGVGDELGVGGELGVGDELGVGGAVALGVVLGDGVAVIVVDGFGADCRLAGSVLHARWRVRTQMPMGS
jgi:hypothetical protein